MFGIHTGGRVQMKKIGRIVIVLGILFILLFLTTGFSFNSPEAVAMNRNTVKYYTTIQVHAGDSLWSIADEYITPEYTDMDSYIQEICAINGIRGDQIHQGSYLNIPYYAEAEDN